MGYAGFSAFPTERDTYTPAVSREPENRPVNVKQCKKLTSLKY